MFFFFYNSRSIKTNSLSKNTSSVLTKTFRDMTPETFLSQSSFIDKMKGQNIMSCVKWVLPPKKFCKNSQENHEQSSYIIHSERLLFLSHSSWVCHQMALCTGKYLSFPFFLSSCAIYKSKAEIFFWPILFFRDRANSANAFLREPYWSKRQALFFYSQWNKNYMD